MSLTRPEKQAIMTAVVRLGNRVTLADVVAATGMSLQHVSQGLNELAASTLATLDVTEKGEIYYSFPAHLYYSYFAHGASKLLNRIFIRGCQSAFLIFRLSFGLVLIASVLIVLLIALIFQSLVAVWTGYGDHVEVMWTEFFLLLRQFFVQHVLIVKQPQNPEINPLVQSSFLLNCYSFLFGDGNPNQYIMEWRWQLIAQVIRQNEGVVLEEHLAPYMRAGNTRDEPTLFQVLLKFDGQPIVTDTGNIVYIFPSMRGRSEVQSYAFLPAYLEERTWAFTQASSALQMRPVLLLAFANLIGSFAFWIICYIHYSTTGKIPALYAFFGAYGVLFWIIPGVRWLSLKVLNKEIRKRNVAAKAAESKLGQPTSEMLARLEESEQIRRVEPTLDSKSIVYTTAVDMLEQPND